MTRTILTPCATQILCGSQTDCFLVREGRKLQIQNNTICSVYQLVSILYIVHIRLSRKSFFVKAYFMFCPVGGGGDIKAGLEALVKVAVRHKTQVSGNLVNWL